MTILHFFTALLCLLFGFPYAQAFDSAEEHEHITSKSWFPNGKASPDDFPRRYVMANGGYVPCAAFTGTWCGSQNAIFTRSDGAVDSIIDNSLFVGCVEIEQADSSGLGGSCLLTLTQEKSLFSGAYMQGTTSATFLEVPQYEDQYNGEVGIPYLVGGHPRSGGGSKKTKKSKKGKKEKKGKKGKKSESSDDYDYSSIIENNGLCLDVKFSSRFSPIESNSIAVAALGTYCREIKPTEEEQVLFIWGYVTGETYNVANEGYDVWLGGGGRRGRFR